MKKKIALVLMLVFTVFALTGCNKNKVTKTKTAKKDTDKQIVLKDEGFGTTTFTYSKDKDYVVKEETGGKYKSLIISSEKENFELQIYHFDTTSASFGTGKANRSDSNGFKEYTWNNYKGYTYNGDKDLISFNILLKDNSNSSKALFGQMQPLNRNEANIEETFRGDNIQKLFNSISFKE